MKDHRELVTLGEELALCERYLDLERLRLGERLRVAWSIDGCPADALIPPLCFSPWSRTRYIMASSPQAEPGTVTIAGELRSGELRIEVANPISSGAGIRQAIGWRSTTFAKG